MILIDKEKLISDVVDRRYSQASMRLIREQPEVEAIPIEFIKETIKLAESVQASKYAEHLKTLLEDWDKENDNEN